MHVPGLKNNFVSVSMLEDLRYDVVFIEGKVFLCHKAMRQMKNIGTQVNNLYKIDVENFVALSTQEEKAEGRYIGEL